MQKSRMLCVFLSWRPMWAFCPFFFAIDPDKLTGRMSFIFAVGIILTFMLIASPSGTTSKVHMTLHERISTLYRFYWTAPRWISCSDLITDIHIPSHIFEKKKRTRKHAHMHDAIFLVCVWHGIFSFSNGHACVRMSTWLHEMFLSNGFEQLAQAWHHHPRPQSRHASSPQQKD